MGMAAGQARLLSITSRLSDNELRAQIINNNKMRLATESSQVSEAYIAALNEAHLMFTSYDQNNNASYQKLTFNALTAFNPYNNQYALLNSGGQVLLSEKDARIYEASTDEESFLAAYGLAYTTSYFENLNSVPFYDTSVPDPEDPNFDGFYYFNGTENVPLSLTGEQIQALYEGGWVDFGDGKIGTINRVGSENMSAYDMTASSSTMYNYEKYLTEYIDAYDTYLDMTASVMQQTLIGLFGGTSDSTIQDIMSGLTGTTQDFTKILEVLNNPTFRNFILGDVEIQNYYQSLVARAEGYQSGNEVSTFICDSDQITGEPNAYYVRIGNEIVGRYNSVNNTFEFANTFDEDSGKPETYYNAMSFSTGSNVYQYHYQGTTDTTPGNYVLGPDEDGSYTTISFTSGTDGNPNVITVSEKLPNDFDYRSAAQTMINEIFAAIMNIWDADNSAWTTATDEISAAYDNYKEAAKNLGEVIYGAGNYDGSNPPMQDLGNIVKLYNEYDSEQQFDPAFKQVFCNLLLDMVMDTYGEPKYAWIDKTSPTDSYNVNGEAKAKWYQNLYALIQKNGYKTILDGLASSSEWMEFAFENGMVQMQQIDEHNAWNNIIYSNCSDIFEQTDDKAIAIAEAEYNAAMNRIENKDKRYDLELKNIDTEHNSLQVEYDSIKTAIDKNIERNFKLYS